MPQLRKLLRVSLLTIALSALCAVAAFATDLGVGTVTADALRLRSEASTTSSILATASEGDLVVILEDTGDGWYKVDFKSVEGYMSADYLTVETQVEANLGYGLVQSEGSTLNVRSGPNTDYGIVTILCDFTVVHLDGMDNGWFKISYGDKTGYVLSDYMITCLDSSGTRGDGPLATAYVSLGQQVVDYAAQFLGKPYVWGGNGPNSFDCSGFTKYVYAHFGVELNRTASAQLYNGTKVSWSNLQPGDLIFFNNGKVSTAASHVGIYVGNGQFIHASTNTYSVQYSNLYSTHYTNTYIAARRIF